MTAGKFIPSWKDIGSDTPFIINTAIRSSFFLNKSKNGMNRWQHRRIVLDCVIKDDFHCWVGSDDSTDTYLSLSGLHFFRHEIKFLIFLRVLISKVKISFFICHPVSVKLFSFAATDKFLGRCVRLRYTVPWGLVCLLLFEVPL